MSYLFSPIWPERMPAIAGANVPGTVYDCLNAALGTSLLRDTQVISSVEHNMRATKLSETALESPRTSEKGPEV